MTTLTNHLRAHWHHHLALWGSAAALTILLTGVGAGVALAFIARGGFHPGPLPPRITISGGIMPSSASLAGNIIRIHNQASSNSCVGQTLSQIAELVEKARGQADPLSAGFIYDQANHGVDQGSSWMDAFSVLTTEGDPPLAAFPHDGQDWWVQPDSAAIAAAHPHRFLAWRSIDPMDTHTIESEIAAGRPLGLAIPAHNDFYNHSCTVPLSSDTGSFHFWHAVTVIGYSPTGIRILNSWGPNWGCNGQGTITWSLLQQYAAQGASIVVGYPPAPQKKPAPMPTKPPAPAKTPVVSPQPASTPTPAPIVLKGTRCNVRADLTPGSSAFHVVCHGYHLKGAES